MSPEEPAMAPAPKRDGFSWNGAFLFLTCLTVLGIFATLIITVLPHLERIEAQTKPAVVEVRPQGYAWDSLPDIRFRNKPDGITDQETLNATLAVLSKAKYLNQLQLCAAELRTEADVQRAVVRAKSLYPGNMPYNHKPGEFEKHYGLFEARVAALDAAAQIAEAEVIPCTSDDTKTWREVEVTIIAKNGMQRAVMVAERGVLFLSVSVEDAIRFRYCLSRQQKALETLGTREVSSTTEVASVFSEQDKYIQDAEYRAIITLLEGVPSAKC